MRAYRAETALCTSLSLSFKNAKQKGRVLLSALFYSDADLIVDYKNNQLKMVIHSLSTPRANEALHVLSDLMNETQTIYPKINLKLVFKSIAQ